MKTPITKARLKHHLTYNLWKYALVLIFSLLGWNLIYTTTAYRPPENKKVDVYISASSGDQDAMDAYLENIRQTEMPDMEQMQCVMMNTVAAGDYYGTMQLATYIMAGEGDIYLLAKDTFISYAGQGAMLPLEEYVENGQLDTRGLDVERGWRVESETGERHLFGIPAESLTGLSQYGMTNLKDTYLCIIAANGNTENAVKLLDILIRDHVAQ